MRYILVPLDVRFWPLADLRQALRERPLSVKADLQKRDF